MKESNEDLSDGSAENKFENDRDKRHSITNIAAGTPSPSNPDPASPTKTRMSQVKTRSGKTSNQPTKTFNKYGLNLRSGI
jgi:hypothetical protein